MTDNTKEVMRRKYIKLKNRVMKLIKPSKQSRSKVQEDKRTCLNE